MAKNGMLFRHKPIVNTIRLINRIEPGSGVLFRENFIKANGIERWNNKSLHRDTKPSHVLHWSFIWSDTPEKGNFWNSIYRKLRKEGM